MESEDNGAKGKPARPFGVTLAILVGVIFFSVLPLSWVGMRVAIEQHVTREQSIVLPDGSELTNEGLSEVEPAFSDEQVVLQVGISVGFLLIAILAWRGKPPIMRHVYVVVVLAISAVLIFQQLSALGGPDNSGGSMDAVIDVVVCGRISGYVLLPLYVAWYLNRAPARAFYRGYYLEDESAALQPVDATQE